LVSIDGDADLSALATKAELASGLADKLNLDTYLIGQSLPGVEVVVPVAPPNDLAEILPSLTNDCSSAIS
jgi:hypothetical protein